MVSMKNTTVSFTVTVARRAEMDAYALEKGFRTASDLARYAVVQHMHRYPARKTKRNVRAVQPKAQEKGSEGVGNAD
jgi:hypothetical protein